MFNIYWNFLDILDFFYPSLDIAPSTISLQMLNLLIDIGPDAFLTGPVIAVAKIFLGSGQC